MRKYCRVLTKLPVYPILFHDYFRIEFSGYCSKFEMKHTILLSPLSVFYASLNIIIRQRTPPSKPIATFVGLPAQLSRMGIVLRRASFARLKYFHLIYY